MAILQSYDSRWAINWQKHNGDYDPVKEILSYYGPLRQMAQSVDIVAPTAPLDGYKLVVAPGLNVVSQQIAQHLIEYVQHGGHLVLGQRSLMKDDDNSLWSERQPGPLVDLLGGRIEQYYALENPVPLSSNWGNGTGQLWAELLSVKSPETQVLMKYGKSNGWLDEQPAMITRQVGNGRITYVGAWPDPELMHNAAKWMLQDSGVTPAFGPELPEGVEVSVRYGKDHKVFILVNCSKTAQDIKLPSAMSDVLSGGQKSEVSLERYGVAVLSEP